jgi:hypothetical protein
MVGYRFGLDFEFILDSGFPQNREVLQVLRHPELLKWTKHRDGG